MAALAACKDGELAFLLTFLTRARDAAATAMAELRAQEKTATQRRRKQNKPKARSR